MSPEALEDLASSIRAQGIIQPIVVRPYRPEQYEIIAGERRWRASQLSKAGHMFLVLSKQLLMKLPLPLRLIENIQREDLNAMEEAQALERLFS